jgi:hypothetical protein
MLEQGVSAYLHQLQVRLLFMLAVVVVVVVVLVAQVVMVVAVAVVLLPKQVLLELQILAVAAVVQETPIMAVKMIHGQVALALLSFVIQIHTLLPHQQQVRRQSQPLAVTEFTNGLHQVQLPSKEKKCRTLQKLRMALLRK